MYMFLVLPQLQSRLFPNARAESAHSATTRTRARILFTFDYIAAHYCHTLSRLTIILCPSAGDHKQQQQHGNGGRVDRTRQRRGGRSHDDVDDDVLVGC